MGNAGSGDSIKLGTISHSSGLNIIARKYNFFTRIFPTLDKNMNINMQLIGQGEGVYKAEVEKGVEHGSIAPRRKWTESIMAEGFGQIYRM